MAADGQSESDGDGGGDGGDDDGMGVGGFRERVKERRGSGRVEAGDGAAGLADGTKVLSGRGMGMGMGKGRGGPLDHTAPSVSEPLLQIASDLNLSVHAKKAMKVIRNLSAVAFTVRLSIKVSLSTMKAVRGTCITVHINLLIHSILLG